MSAFKDFTVYREQTLGFRFDAFNALNIASYGNPDTGVADTTFGQFASQGSPTRCTIGAFSGRRITADKSTAAVSYGPESPRRLWFFPALAIPVHLSGE